LGENVNTIKKNRSRVRGGTKVDIEAKDKKLKYTFLSRHHAARTRLKVKKDSK
jgi:hypothetical protein